MEVILDYEKLKVAIFMFAFSGLVAIAIYAVNSCGVLP